MPTRENGDALAAAIHAEEAGDFAGAALALRRHLAREPQDHRSRLRLGRVLLSAGELALARAALAPIETEAAVGPEATALLAELDELAGLSASAASRWERLLADDIDHARARARLRALRPDDGPPPSGAADAGPTLVAPDGTQALRYRLLRELGRGSSSAVYLARDESLGIDIALKVLHPHLAAPACSDARRRFFSEARTAAALRHPGVVAIYDLDEASRTLAMEYVPGGTLRARLRAAAVDAAEALATARSLLAALAYVHGCGVVHGDLKPGNLLLRRPGAVVLADFGIAHLAGNPAPGADTPAGTPLYLAPEQFRGAPSSVFTDLYAAGTIFWEMLAGHPMRDHSDLLGTLAQPRPLPPAALAPLGADADAVAELVTRLVDPDPARRLPGAAVALRFL